MNNSGLSLIDLKGISEPLTKLIESVSQGIGAIYEPTAKVRNAKAEAKEMAILAEARVNADAITLRALERVKYVEIRRQQNIDSIVKGASIELPENVSAEPVDEDWIVSFFDLCQDVRNSEMQQIWSKLLAGEVAMPGTFRPRTLQTVKSITTEEAQMFTKLCSFSFCPSDGEFIFPCFSHDFYVFIRENGISTEVETHLKNIGLLSNSQIYYGQSEQNILYLNYFSEHFYTELQTEEGQETPYFHCYPFTAIGKELAPISGAKPNDEYIQCLIESKNITIQ